MEKKTILITGASSGIGAASAKLLSADYRIILCGRDKTRLEEILTECHGKDNLTWEFDLASVNEIENSLADFLTSNSVQVAGLVHCAGMIKYLPIKMFSATEFQNMLNVNVTSAALILKTLLSRKVNSSALESVVLISSNISNFGAKAHSLYSASKAALDGFMRSAAVELAPKIRVNSILPGALETRMTTEVFSNSETVEKMLSNYPLGRGETSDIAKAIRFLISDESCWITGQQLTVDGGRTINLSV